jgi:transcriptional regulator with XRE-family HTH domain
MTARLLIDSLMDNPSHPNSIKLYRLKFYPRPLTQNELGRLIGVHRSRISLYEIGAVFPSGQMLFRLSSALNVPAEILYKSFCDDERTRMLELKKQFGIFKTGPSGR